MPRRGMPCLSRAHAREYVKMNIKDKYTEEYCIIYYM